MQSQGRFVESGTDQNDMTDLISWFIFTQRIASETIGLLYSKLCKVMVTISDGTNYLSGNEKMPTVEMKKDNEKKLDLTLLRLTLLKNQYKSKLRLVKHNSLWINMK